MSHIVDTVQELSPLLIVQVLPLASDNLNRILRKKESAGRAVGTGKEWTALSEDRERAPLITASFSPSRVLERTYACRARCGFSFLRERDRAASC